MPKRLAKTVYVYEATDGDDIYPICNYSLEECAEKGETRLVGVYELKETIKVTLKVTEEVVKTKA